MITKLHSRGFSLVETVVSVGIMALIFSVMGFLTFLTARNAHNVHQQVISQTEAARAAQAVSTLMRNSIGYALYPSDRDSATSPTGPFTRFQIVNPAAGNNVTTHTVALFVDDNNEREVRYFDRELAEGDFEDKTITFNEGHQLRIRSPRPEPTRSWRKIANFLAYWHSEYRITLETSYRYKGFAYQFSNPEYDPEGLFQTDAISKNHFMDEGVYNYAQGNVTTPASL